MPKISELVSTGIKGLWGTETVSAECGIPVIKTNNLSYEGVIDYTDICYRDIPKDKAEKNYLQNGDILAEKSGGTKTHSVGYVGYFDGESNKFVCNNFILALRPNREKCLSKYLFYQMRYMYENGIFADCYNRTTGIQNLQVGEYLGKSVKNPVIEEQEQAVSMLDAIVSQIDNAKQRLLALDELVKSRFIEMFGNPLSDEYTTPFSQACVFNPKKTEKKDWTDDLLVSFVPMPLVSEHGEIQTSNIKSYSEVKKGFTYFRENDVLFAKITPCMENGKGAIAINLQNGIGFGSTEFHVFRPIENISNPYWVYYLMAIDSFRIMAEKKMTGSAGQKRVPISFFENLKVNLPPISLQNEFAEFVKLIDKSKFVCQFIQGIFYAKFARFRRPP